MKKILSVFTALVVVFTSWSFISKDAAQAPYAADIFIEPDSVFMKVAASSNMMEIELGNMAQQKATNPRIKNFGAMMVQEHTRATQELKTLAQSKGVTLPATMMRQHSRHVDYLRDLSGPEFDQMYTRVMVEEHREDVDEFEDASKKAQDADVRAWAGKMLPHLQAHLDTARNLRNFVRNNYSDMGGATTNQTTNAAHGDMHGGGTTGNTGNTTTTTDNQGTNATMNNTTGTQNNTGTTNQNGKNKNTINKKTGNQKKGGNQ